jgi:Ca-activated chloride channel family protein
MRTRHVAAFAGAALAAGLLLAQTPTFRVSVKLVRVLATVKNAQGDLVGDLKLEDFQIFDSGAPQEIKIFERHTEQPLSIALLIDTSASTGIDIKYELESVNRFLHAMLREGNEGDAVKLYAFNYEVSELTSFTRRLDTLERSLRGLHSVGGTSLYDAIDFAAGALEGREGRHVIVVVTDGGDTTSGRNFHQALESAQMADAVIYPILVVPITNDAGRNVGGENALTLLSRGTAGRVFAPTLGKELDRAFDDIIRELRTQYLLGYYPKDLPPSKDRFHPIEVRLHRSDLRVSARSGYYGEAEAAKGWTPVR